MKKNFIFTVGIIFFSIQSIHAMFRLRNSHKILSKTLHHTSTSVIASYDNVKDEKLVSAIALKNMPYPMSHFMDENYKKSLLEEKVMPAITSDDPHARTKVYRVDDKAVGFINYYIDVPWYIIFIPSEFRLRIKNHAKIQMLAVDINYRNRGIGSALVKHVEEDLKMEYVDRINTGLVEPQFDRFYKQLGFEHQANSLVFSLFFSEFTKYIGE
jgi:ribosomal protein S18 acetylase RimI-like enzyme